MIQELIQSYFDAFNAHDLEAQLATLSNDVIHDLNEGGREAGIEAFRAFKTHMDTCYREQIVDLCIMTSGDSRGAAEFVVRGEYIGTDEGLPEANGQKYEIPAAAFFECAEGKITRVTSYYNLRQWIAAVQV
ncbi:MAG TPA: ketosteroid isomerase-related protein [Fimbriimonas sp.]|nr:ketosteroid isomerase-related protein [Fimbriimonas sp.]